MVKAFCIRNEVEIRAFSGRVLNAILQKSDDAFNDAQCYERGTVTTVPAFVRFVRHELPFVHSKATSVSMLQLWEAVSQVGKGLLQVLTRKELPWVLRL